jgi:hypothetical protein
MKPPVYKNATYYNHHAQTKKCGKRISGNLERRHNIVYGHAHEDISELFLASLSDKVVHSILTKLAIASKAFNLKAKVLHLASINWNISATYVEGEAHA